MQATNVARKFLSCFEERLNCAKGLQVSLDELKSKVIPGFRALSDAFWCNNIDTFSLLLEHASESNLKNAREVVDKIYGKKRTQEMFRLRQAVLCRQQTE